jgi:DNA-binding response OmpR family regulator
LRTDAPPILAPAAPQPAAFKPPPIVRPRTQHGGIVMWRGQGVRLSSTRYRLVSYLHARRHLCSTEDIAEHLWRVVDDGTKANVRVVICQTRALLPGLIDSVPGWGYRLTTSRLEGMR